MAGIIQPAVHTLEFIRTDYPAVKQFHILEQFPDFRRVLLFIFSIAIQSFDKFTEQGSQTETFDELALVLYRLHFNQAVLYKILHDLRDIIFRHRCVGGKRPEIRQLIRGIMYIHQAYKNDESAFIYSQDAVFVYQDFIYRYIDITHVS